MSLQRAARRLITRMYKFVVDSGFDSNGDGNSDSSDKGQSVANCDSADKSDKEEDDNNGIGVDDCSEHTTATATSCTSTRATTTKSRFRQSNLIFVAGPQDPGA